MPWYLGGCAGFIFPPALVLFIPGIVEAFKAPKANQKLVLDFDERAFDSKSKIKVNPNTSMDLVFFVKKQDLPDNMTLSLRNTKTKNFIDFDFNLNVLPDKAVKEA